MDGQSRSLLLPFVVFHFNPPPHIIKTLKKQLKQVAKTRQQLAGGKTLSMISIFRDIIQNEGPANLYRGVWSPVMAEAPKRAIKFSLNAVRWVVLACFVFAFGCSCAARPAQPSGQSRWRFSRSRREIYSKPQLCCYGISYAYAKRNPKPHSCSYF